MNKHITVGISSISLLISIAALCIAAYRTPSLAFDYQGVLVGILSALVTVLIGWNIYSALDLKREIEKVEQAKQTIIYHSERNAITTFMSIAEYYGKEIGIRPNDDPGFRYIYFNLSNFRVQDLQFVCKCSFGNGYTKGQIKERGQG